MAMSLIPCSDKITMGIMIYTCNNRPRNLSLHFLRHLIIRTTSTATTTTAFVYIYNLRIS